MFDWMPLIGDMPFWEQTLWLTLGCFVLFVIGIALVGISTERYRHSQGESLMENGGLAITAIGTVFGPIFAAMFIVSGVAAAWPENVPDPPVPASRIAIDPDWDAQRIEVRCPYSQNVGEIEILGHQTPSLFRVEAVRMRTGSPEGDLSVDAGFMIYERQMWRSQTPMVLVEGFRADGRWQSQLMNTTLILTRGNGFLMNAGLGTAPEEYRGEIEDREQQCEGLLVAF